MVVPHLCALFLLLGCAIPYVFGGLNPLEQQFITFPNGTNAREYLLYYSALPHIAGLKYVHLIHFVVPQSVNNTILQDHKEIMIQQFIHVTNSLLLDCKLKLIHTRF